MTPSCYSPRMELTQRQREVMDLLVTGMSNREIAEQLGMALRTVKAHLKFAALQNGYKKVSRVELLRAYRQSFNPETGLPLPATLTPAKLEVARLVISGLSNKEVAARRGTTEHVIKNYMRVVLDATGCWSRSELAARYSA